MASYFRSFKLMIEQELEDNAHFNRVNGNVAYELCIWYSRAEAFRLTRTITQMFLVGSSTGQNNIKQGKRIKKKNGKHLSKSRQKQYAQFPFYQNEKEMRNKRRRRKKKKKQTTFSRNNMGFAVPFIALKFFV